MNPIKTILFPTDQSELCRSAFCVASALARDCKARLIILEVVPPPVMIYGPPPESYYEQMRDALDQLQVRDPEVCVERLVAEGDPVNQIVRVAEESKCDLILMATHARTGVSRLLTGSVAEKVVRRSRCPVLVIKSRDVPCGPREAATAVSGIGLSRLGATNSTGNPERGALAISL